MTELTVASPLLGRELYSMEQVDYVLGLRSGTARRWIDGYERRGKQYPPILRPTSTGDGMVTWGEFVETYLISQYRERRIGVGRLHPVVDHLRRETGSLYPLVSAKLLVEGRELVQRVQEEEHLDRSLYLVVRTRNNQLQLAPVVEDYLERIDWQNDIAERLFPIGRDALVTIDPLHSFGMPAVRSIRTEVIAEEFRAGDSVSRIAAGYDLDAPLVEAALRYEQARARAA